MYLVSLLRHLEYLLDLCSLLWHRDLVRLLWDLEELMDLVSLLRDLEDLMDLVSLKGHFKHNLPYLVRLNMICLRNNIHNSSQFNKIQ